MLWAVARCCVMCEESPEGGPVDIRNYREGGKSMKHRAMVTAGVVSLLLFCFGVSAAAPGRCPEVLDSVLWQQASAEYEAVCLETYQAAKRMLLAALPDRSWTAAPEQRGDFSKLPPAVILDIDETILDNSPFAAYLVKQGIPFNRDLWFEWAKRAQAKAIPGALDFVRYAHKLGIFIFYVTNRDHELERATRENLRRLGFPVDQKPDTILSRNEKPGWTRDKTSRRRFIAGRYRVLFLFGDDLNDFVSTAGLSVGARKKRAARYRRYWGTRWFILPNPVYGSWQRALYSSPRDARAKKLQEEFRHLEPFKK